jgi:hypothetical protein
MWFLEAWYDFENGSKEIDNISCADSEAEGVLKDACELGDDIKLKDGVIIDKRVR